MLLVPFLSTGQLLHFHYILELFKKFLKFLQCFDVVVICISLDRDFHITSGVHQCGGGGGRLDWRTAALSLPSDSSLSLLWLSVGVCNSDGEIGGSIFILSKLLLCSEVGLVLLLGVLLLPNSKIFAIFCCLPESFPDFWVRLLVELD